MLNEPKLSEGQILGGRYRIKGVIGSGGMSHVYLAEDLRLQGKSWAVKECVTTGMSSRSVQAEAELLISLNHHRLPKVIDFHPPDEDDYSYLIMDYIQGVTLSRYMQAHPEPLPIATIMLFARQLLEVLQYLHTQNPPIVYRDLKPSNIMVNEQNELMLIDFGIARSCRSGGSEDTVKLGTVGFAAPEQYGSGRSGPASDLYGMGALLLYMATCGKYSQWSNGMDRQLRGKIPKALISIIQCLLQYRPEDRFQDAIAVLQALQKIEAGNKSMPHSHDFSRNRTSVIALLGVAHGLGTTHTSLAVSSYLSRVGPTAWVDASPDSSVHGRIRSMVNAIEATDSTAETFEWKGAHYWRRPELGRLDELMGGMYKYVILDLGIGEFEGALDAFYQSDLPLLMASGADWRLEEVLLWLRRRTVHLQAKLKIGLPLCGRPAVTFLQQAIGEGKVYRLPQEEDPFKLGNAMDAVIGTILQDLIESKMPNKRASFFRKKELK